MRSLILHPTDTSQWHALINEAQASAHLALSEKIESYLVFMLMRYVQKVKWIESILALDLLESWNKPNSIKIDTFREIGDSSLLFCGLFPQRASRLRLSPGYYTDMGQAAYLAVSELNKNSDSELFLQLSENFLDLQTVLQAIRTNQQFTIVDYCNKTL